MRSALVALACCTLAASTVAAQAWSLLYTLEHPEPGQYSEFGLVLASVGDLDGDGTHDIAVGAAEGINGEGRVYLYSGADGTRLDSLSSIYSAFGRAMTRLDDLDGDGVSELLVASPGERVGGAQGAGRVYIYSGATRDTVRTTVSPSPMSSRRFGTAVADLGEVDGDGLSDYAVAERERVHLFSGATGDTLRTLRSPNPEPNGQFGAAVAAIGDTDGDGIPDLLVAAYNEAPGFTGRAYLFSGATGALLRTLSNPTWAVWNGLTFADPGDLDADGTPDALLGAPFGDFGSGEEGYPDFVGRVYVVSGASGGFVRTLRSPNEGTLRRQGSTFGEALAVVGDEDGDGIAEFAVAEPYAGGNGQVQGGGQVHVFSGAAGASPLTTLVNPARDDPSLRAFEFGRSLAALRMADGSVRLAVASEDQRADDPGGQTFGRGRVYVYSRFPVASSPSAPVAGLSVSVSPNPARSSATLALRLAEASSVRVAVVDALGRVVRRFDAGLLAPGAHRLALDVDGLPPGVYVVRVTAGDGAASARLVVAR